MSQSRVEIKVGLFVLVGLALLGFLFLKFSKGSSSFRKTYELRLKATNVGGLRPRSFVLISGVAVGTVSAIKLSPEGTNVIVLLSIFSDFKIHKDARFLIEQSGFLGDQYVAIVPTANKLEPWPPGSEVTAEEPFNLQEAARSAGGFLLRADETAKKINEIIAEVRQQVLNEKTLTNLSVAVANIRHVSEQAVTTMETLSALVQANAPVVSQSLSNVSNFSARLGDIGDSTQNLIAENREKISAAVHNIENATIMLTNILNEIQSGKGLAGTLVHNEQVATNVSHIVANLSITTSNLNKLGVWRILWKPRDAKQAAAKNPVEILRAPKN